MKTAGLDTATIRCLVVKDWYLNRWLLLAILAFDVFVFATTKYTASPVIYPVLRNRIGEELAYYAYRISGYPFLFFHFNLIFVSWEREARALPFLMSLPISPREYRASKIVTNLAVVLVPWIINLGCVLYFAASRESLPDGIIPFAAIVLTSTLAGYCVNLAILTAVELKGWNLASAVAGPAFALAFPYYFAQRPGIAVSVLGNSATFTPLEAGVLACLLALILATLALAIYYPWRRTDFV